MTIWATTKKDLCSNNKINI